MKIFLLNQSYRKKTDPSPLVYQEEPGQTLPPALKHLPKGNRSNPLVGLTWLAIAGITACSIGPTPLTLKELSETAQSDTQTLADTQDPVAHPIDLYEAMARALKYNLDYRIQLLEKTVALSDVDLSTYAMLPKLAASAGFVSRNTIEASSSYSLATQQATKAFSSSSDQDKTTANLSVVWNVLDFGVSYFQAKQTADRLLIAEENRRKLVHTQLQEVQSAFWHAVSAQELQDDIEPVLQQAQQALADAYVVEKEGLRPQLEMMRYQRALLDIIRKLEALRDKLELAKKSLAKLINLPTNLPLQLQIPKGEDFRVVPIRITLEEMEQLALQNRPELRNAVYDTRISAAETRKALLRLLPGLEFKTTTHYDSNSYALNPTWETAGLQVTSNLMNLVSGPANLRLAKNKEALSQMRRMAMSMAILSQVHIAFRKYQDSTRSFETERTISDIDQRVLANISNSAGLNTQNRLDQIQAATQGIMSQLQRNRAFAETQNALGLMFVSLGVDFLPVTKPDAPLATLSQALREAMKDWNDGISSAPTGDVFAMGRVLSARTARSGMPRKENGYPFLNFEFTLGRAPTTPATDTQSCLQETTTQEMPSHCNEAALPPETQETPQATTEAEHTTHTAGTDEHIQRPAPESTTGVAHNRAPAGQNPVPHVTQTTVQQQGTTPNQPPQHPTPVQSTQTTTVPPQQPATPPQDPQPVLVENTPAQVVSPEQITTPDQDQPATPVEEVRTLVKAWVKAWSKQRVDSFLALYSPAFQPAGNWTKQQWTQSYRDFLAASSAKVVLTDLAVELETTGQARAFVHLAFESDKKKRLKRKTLTLSREGEAWRIVAERSGIQFGQNTPQPVDIQPTYPQPMDPQPENPPQVDPQPMEPPQVNPQSAEPLQANQQPVLPPQVNPKLVAPLQASLQLVQPPQVLHPRPEEPPQVNPQPVEPLQASQQPVEPLPQVNPKPVEPPPQVTPLPVDPPQVNPQPVEPRQASLQPVGPPQPNPRRMALSQVNPRSLASRVQASQQPMEPSQVTPRPTHPPHIEPHPASPPRLAQGPSLSMSNHLFLPEKSVKTFKKLTMSRRLLISGHTTATTLKRKAQRLVYAFRKGR